MNDNDKSMYVCSATHCIIEEYNLQYITISVKKKKFFKNTTYIV